MKVIFLLTEEVVNTYKSLPCDYEQPSLKSTPEDPLLELILHLRVIHAFIRWSSKPRYTLSLVDQILQNAGIPEVFIHQPSLL